MTTFQMNSLIGTDSDGNDIICRNDDWVALDQLIYRDIFNEVQENKAAGLLEAIRLSSQFSFIAETPAVYFVEYDLPVAVICAPKSMQAFAKGLASNTPGARINGSDSSNTGLCHRVRLRFSKIDRTCLFPYIVMSSKPPKRLDENPLLTHEIVHLRYTLTEKYDEHGIMLSYWNADLQDFYRQNFGLAISEIIKTYLEEEWEACAANHDDKSRNQAFTSVYIPGALSSCANLLDWWLNDESRPLRIGKISLLISRIVFETLKKLGYNDLDTQFPMSPNMWRTTIDQSFREAYQLWMKNPGPFPEKLKEALST
jgi:hypothetical protein